MMLPLPLALAIVQPQAAPPAAITLAPDTETRWVGFELTPTNQIRFTVDVNGRPARAILDTGLSDTVATPRFAAEAGLQPDAREPATAIGGSVEVAWARVSSIAFGGLERRGGRLGISTALGQERFGTDLYVGADVLGCCALDIDYDNRRFRILPSGRLPFSGATAPLDRMPRSGIYVSQVKLAGTRLHPMVVDTGDGAAITLSRAAWRSTRAEGRVTTTLGWGMGGAVVTDTVVVSSLSIAGMAPRETEVRIEPADGFSASIGTAGRIGTGLMLRYRVLLDPNAKRMVLRAGKAADEAVVRSTSGLLLDYTGKALRVLHVMRGSPAEQGGWRAGETICAADGVSVADQVRASGTVDWAVGPPGRTVRLTLCGGGDRTLTLRSFY
ncbi:MAG: aspartyl protease family protein [Sphingomonas sp.]|uniref:aspartyl protease family protein n=1 Tax=Sphingomonas sp. TaxID=28214 RepID=UPI001AFF0B59|nr:aspartyl protease family protein [Sphingomonas sp.]MBO9624464.1 aspartyl protease family protein [Sphingomonas sp.]